MLVPKIAIDKLATICDQGSSRYALACILLERDQDGAPVAIATDGRRMVAFSWIEPENHPLLTPENRAAKPGFSALLSAAAIKQIRGWRLDKKTIARRPELGYILVDEFGPPASKEKDSRAALPVSASDLVSKYAIDDGGGDGRFPKWRGIFGDLACRPETDADVAQLAITLDAEYLAELCQSFCGMAVEDGARGVTFHFTSHDRPIWLSVDRADGRRAAALLMPLARGHEAHYSAPNWNPAIPAPYLDRAIAEQLERLRLDCSAEMLQGLSVDRLADPRYVAIRAPGLGLSGVYRGAEALRYLRSTPKLKVEALYTMLRAAFVEALPCEDALAPFAEGFADAAPVDSSSDSAAPVDSSSEDAIFGSLGR